MPSPIAVTINGAAISSIIEGSFRIESILGSTIDTATLSIYDKDCSLVVPEQADIIITRTDTGGRIFGGLTSMPSAYTEGLSRYYDLSCQDYTILLDTTIAFNTYPSGYTYAGLTGDQAIIANLFEKSILNATGTGQASEIEARTNVGQALASMAAMYFNYQTLRECVTTIANYSGWNYFVDYSKSLHYYLKTTTAAPFDLSSSPNNTTTLGYRNLKWKRDGTSIRNFYLIFGTNLFSSTQTYYLPSNGVKTTLTLGITDLNANVILQPPAGSSNILVWKNTGTDGSPVWTALTVGISGIDTVATKDCVHNATQQTLQFAAAPPNMATNSIKIQAVYMMNGGQADSEPSSIAKYNSRQFGKRLTASDANSAVAMAAKLKTYKAQFAYALNTCTLTIDDDMFPAGNTNRFEVGQWLHLTNGILNKGWMTPPLDAKGFQIYKITTTIMGGTKLSYTLELRDWYTEVAV